MAAQKITSFYSGDALITRPYAPRADQDFLQLLNSVDVRFTNLEMLLNDYRGTPTVEAGGLHLSAPPSIGRDLLNSGFNLFANANNHSLDSNTDGLEIHIEAMRSLGMKFAGVGEALGEASAPVYLDTPNGRVAMISCASSIAPGHRAGERRTDFRGRPGLNPLRFDTVYELPDEMYDQLSGISEALGIAAMQRWTEEMEFRKPVDDPENQQRFIAGGHFDKTKFQRAETARIRTSVNKVDLERNIRNIEHAKRQADFVIVSIHAHEADIQIDKPAEFIKEFAHACIDAGADVFTGSGPHLMRGIEIYEGKPIFYSLGNLWFEFETVNLLPADSYEMWDRDAATETPADLYDTSLLGFHKDCKYWECAVPVCTFEDGSLTNVDLHCMTLGFDEPRGRRGTPRTASQEDAERILAYVGDLSDEFGTSISVVNGVGSIDL